MSHLNLKDITGQKFGRLTVVERAENAIGRSGMTRWLCECECGKKKVIMGCNLRSGAIISCGCFNSENRKAKMKTHGFSKTKLYGVWTDMITRCENPKAHHYKWYGQRGVTVCEEWRSDFMNFKLDMGDGYYEELELDRIDTDGNYCKSNCRWVSPKENCRNKRNNTFITVDNETKLLVEWAEQFNVPYTSIHVRLKRGHTGMRAILGHPRNVAKK